MMYRIIVAVIILSVIKAPDLYSQKVSDDNKSQRFEFSPADFTLNKIDTTIVDSIRLTVRHYTLMDTYATAYGVTSDSITSRYRDYAIEVEMSVGGRKIIDKKYLKSDFIGDERYWPHLTLFKVRLYPSDVEKNQVRLKVWIGIPNFSTPVIASLILGYDGSELIKLK
jgi:hypothetical protein